MNVKLYPDQPFDNTGGGYPTGYSPQFNSTSESYLCSNQAMNDKMTHDLEHERRIAQSRTSYDEMPDFVKQNYVGPKYGTQEYQQEMNAKYGAAAPNYIKPQQVQQMIQNDYSMPEPRPYTPGMNGPIVCERPDGSVDYIFTDRNMNTMQGGFEPQGQTHQNHINAFSTDSMEQKQMRESQYQDMPFDQVMNPPMYQNMGFQPSQFTYDQFGNAIPMMQPSMFAYDQFGNMIPAQPQMMGNPYMQPQPIYGNPYMQQQPLYGDPYMAQQPMYGNPYMQQQVPPQPQDQYVQSGTVTYNNGYNPYLAQQQGSSTGNKYLDYMNNSRNPYTSTTIRNPYTGAMMNYNANPYWHNSFDPTYGDILYSMDISHFTENVPVDMLISDEERRVAEQKRREDEAASIYNMTYGLPTMQQYNMYRSEFEQYKKNTCDLYSDLHAAVNSYFGKEYTEEEDRAVREAHNPLKQLEDAMERANKSMGFGINYGKLSPSEMKEMEELRLVREVAHIDNDMLREIYYYQPMRDQARAALYKKIKESHDKMLGLKPGETCNLDYYLNHGHELVRNAFINDRLLDMRNAKFRQYDSNRFKTNIYNHTEEAKRTGIRPEFLTARPVMAAPGGEFSAEKMQILKNLYDRSGGHMIDIQGVKSYTNLPKSPYRADVSEDPARIVSGEAYQMTDRMRKFKEGAEDMAEQFKQIQSVYGDRRRKSE